MRHEEAIFAKLVESIRPGARMTYQVEQAHGECDFRLMHDGHTYPFEVTRYTDQRAEELAAAVRGKDSSGELLQRRIARHDWYITPDQSANIRSVRAHIDRYLSAIELEGLTRFDIRGHHESSPAVRQLWDELRVLDGNQLKLPPPGYIWIGLPGDGALLNNEQVLVAVEAEAAKADNRRKLRCDASERHLGVYIDPWGFPAHGAMCAGLIPLRDPALPAEITHAWVACLCGDDKYLAWSWSEGAWHSHGTFDLQVPHSDA